MFMADFGLAQVAIGLTVFNIDMNKTKQNYEVPNLYGAAYTSHRTVGARQCNK
jgi:hypothetical protein